MVKFITVDGVDYSVLEGSYGAIEVVDCEGRTVATADVMSTHETVHCSYYDEGGHIEECDGTFSDLYEKSTTEIAEWLCATHPSN